MKNDIEPVYLSSLPSLVEELFGPSYRANRLGIPGEWGGSDRFQLQLEKTVNRDQLCNLFANRTPNGEIGPSREWVDSDPVVAHRVTYIGSPAVSTLWALGTLEQRHSITLARMQATDQSMGLIRRVSLLESESQHPLMLRGCVYAAFNRGAAEDQTPRLETTVLIARQYRLPNGNEVHFPLSLAPGAAGEMFSRWEWRRLGGLIGNVGLTQQTQVPDGLFSPPTLKELLGNNPVPPGGVTNRRLAGKELFSVWSQQAEARGFGPREVQKVFDAAHRLGRIVRSHYNGLSAEGALAAWDALNRTGVKQSVSHQTVKSPDRGPSL